MPVSFFCPAALVRTAGSPYTRIGHSGAGPGSGDVSSGRFAVHFGRSLIISLVLCIVFFVVLRPPDGPVEGTPEPVGSSQPAPDSADSSGQAVDTLRGR